MGVTWAVWLVSPVNKGAEIKSNMFCDTHTAAHALVRKVAQCCLSFDTT